MEMLVANDCVVCEWTCRATNGGGEIHPGFTQDGAHTTGKRRLQHQPNGSLSRIAPFLHSQMHRCSITGSVGVKLTSRWGQEVEIRLQKTA